MSLAPFVDIPKWNHINIGRFIVVDQCTYSRDGVNRLISRNGGVELTPEVVLKTIL